jgi:hypothetical protein
MQINLSQTGFGLHGELQQKNRPEAGNSHSKPREVAFTSI